MPLEMGSPLSVQRKKAPSRMAAGKVATLKLTSNGLMPMVELSRTRTGWLALDEAGDGGGRVAAGRAVRELEGVMGVVRTRLADRAGRLVTLCRRGERMGEPADPAMLG